MADMWTIKENARLRELYDAGLPNKAIAKTLGRTEASIRGRIHQMICNNWKPQRTGRTREEKNAMLEMREAGIAYSEIGAKYGVTAIQAKEIVAKWKMTLRNGQPAKPRHNDDPQVRLPYLEGVPHLPAEILNAFNDDEPLSDEQEQAATVEIQRLKEQVRERWQTYGIVN